MSEEKKVSGLGQELLPEELEQVNGGALSDEEIAAYLEQYDDPNLRRAWEVAIGILINYPGWDYDRYAGIADALAAHLIDGRHVSGISQKKLKSILLQAHEKFHWKTFH